MTSTTTTTSNNHYDHHRPSGVVLPFILREKLHLLVPPPLAPNIITNKTATEVAIPTITTASASATATDVTNTNNNDKSSVDNNTNNILKKDDTKKLPEVAMLSTTEKVPSTAEIATTTEKTEPAQENSIHKLKVSWKEKEPSNLKTTTSKKLEQQIHKVSTVLTDIQRQLYHGEEAYYEETVPYGNIFKGWDNNFIDYKLGAMSHHMNGPGGIINAVPSSNTKRRIPEDDRWFTSSSHIPRHMHRISTTLTSSHASSRAAGVANASHRIVTPSSSQIIASQATSNPSVVPLPTTTSNPNINHIQKITATTATDNQSNNKEHPNIQSPATPQKIQYQIPRKQAEQESAPITSKQSPDVVPSNTNTSTNQKIKITTARSFSEQSPIQLTSNEKLPDDIIPSSGVSSSSSSRKKKSSDGKNNSTSEDGGVVAEQLSTNSSRKKRKNKRKAD